MHVSKNGTCIIKMVLENCKFKICKIKAKKTNWKLPWNKVLYIFLNFKNSDTTPKCGNGILLPKLFWPTVRKNCSSDREKLLKFEAEGQEFEKIFESTRTIYFKQWKVRTIFGNRMLFQLVPGGFS